jgi:5-methylcytosine-specific restriction protein A
MPDAPVKPCHAPGCGEYAVNRGYCREHQRYLNIGRNTKDRGYGGDWVKFRAWFLRRHPACADCPDAATEVHHEIKIAVRPDLRLVESNCEGLCESCHSKRTRAGQ